MGPGGGKQGIKGEVGEHLGHLSGGAERTAGTEREKGEGDVATFTIFLKKGYHLGASKEKTAKGKRCGGRRGVKKQATLRWRKTVCLESF